MFGLTRAARLSACSGFQLPVAKKSMTRVAPLILVNTATNAFSTQHRLSNQRRHNTTTSKSGLRMTHFDATPSEGKSQSPHPMLFLHGAWDPPGAWEATAKHFCMLGHETGIHE
jgi:hypothetical protein